MIIEFLKDVELQVVESYDEDHDEGEYSKEIFHKGDRVDGDAFNDFPSAIDLQFGDGSCVFNLNKSLFTVIEG